MDTGVIAALAALGGVALTKLADAVIGWRKSGVDQEAATRVWYTTEFAKLREEITRQDAKIEALEARVDTQRATIRLHEDTIAAQSVTIGLLRGRISDLESKQGTQQIDLNVTMASDAGAADG